MFRIGVACSVLLLAASGGATAHLRRSAGSYLVNTIMACGNCHTPRNADGKPPVAYTFYGGPKPADLADIIAWLRTVPPLQ